MRHSTERDAGPTMTRDADSLDHLQSQLARLQSGDRAALAELYEAYATLVYGAALRLCANAADAEDVAQDVFLRLSATVRGFTGPAARFPAWLRRVAVRQALMLMRGSRRRREVDVDGVVGLLAPPQHQAERLTIDVALARLSDEHRTVFLLKEVEGYGHQEIAELLGISVANSEVRLHRARHALRALLRGSR